MIYWYLGTVYTIKNLIQKKMNQKRTLMTLLMNSNVK
nr:MAG TPA: hypothetical protein [Caudoviricetes sp.]